MDIRYNNVLPQNFNAGVFYVDSRSTILEAFYFLTCITLLGMKVVAIARDIWSTWSMIADPLKVTPATLSASRKKVGRGFARVNSAQGLTAFDTSSTQAIHQRDS